MQVVQLASSESMLRDKQQVLTAGAKCSSSSGPNDSNLGSVTNCALAGADSPRLQLLVVVLFRMLPMQTPQLSATCTL